MYGLFELFAARPQRSTVDCAHAVFLLRSGRHGHLRIFLRHPQREVRIAWEIHAKWSRRGVGRPAERCTPLARAWGAW